MQYYRCQCGSRESHGSYAPPSCVGCGECGTTLETSPSLHRTPDPHDYEREWRITNPRSGERGVFVQCRRCNAGMIEHKDPSRPELPIGNEPLAKWMIEGWERRHG